MDDVDTAAGSKAEIFRELREQLEDLFEDIEEADLDVLDRLSIFHDVVDRAQGKCGDLARSAYDGGYTWTEIGDSVGTSRQAAQQRFGRRARD